MNFKGNTIRVFKVDLGVRGSVKCIEIGDTLKCVGKEEMCHFNVQIFVL